MRRLAAYAVEWALLVAVAGAVAFSAGGAFYVAPAVQHSPLLLVALPGAVAACAVARGRLAVPVRVGLAAAVGALAVGVASSLAPPGAVLADVEENPVVFTMVCTVVSYAVALLSRTKPGCVVLAAAAAVVCAVVELAYGWGYVASAALALGACTALVVLASWRAGAGSEAAGSPAPQYGPLPAASLAGAAAFGALAVGGALLAWVLVVAPLDPPTAPVVLFTRTLALEEIEIEGAQNTAHQNDPDLQSDQERDSDRASAMEGEQDSSPDPSDLLGGSPALQMAAQLLGSLDPTALVTTLSAIRYDAPPWAVPVIVLAAAAALALAVAVKRHLRRRRLERARAMPARAQAVALYRYLDDRFRRIGLPRAPQLTPAEFAHSVADRLDRIYGEGAHEQFAAGTQAFCAALYGADDPAPEDLVAACALAERFPAAARAQLGTPRYLLRWFRL